MQDWQRRALPPVTLSPNPGDTPGRLWASPAQGTFFPHASLIGYDLLEGASPPPNGICAGSAPDRIADGPHGLASHRILSHRVASHRHPRRRLRKSLCLVPPLSSPPNGAAGSAGLAVAACQPNIVPIRWPQPDRASGCRPALLLLQVSFWATNQ
ncbi:hypothetical protein LZ31DRAFT_554460 [Colletotrichum somersetense]|nr:hypothetical protein LZ31DRAFT_554460 [Colletotrichum somersetense]